MSAKRSNQRERRRGIALLMVLLLIMVLTVIVWSFQRDVAREVSVTNNVRDGLQAELLAQMGMVKGQAMLRLDEHAEFDSLNEDWAKPPTWEGETFGAGDDMDSYDEDTEGGSSGSASQEPDVHIVDEARKFNLLTLVRGEEKDTERAAEILERLLNICLRKDDRLQLDEAANTTREIGDENYNPQTLVKNLIKYLKEKPRDESDELEMETRAPEDRDVRGMKKQSPFEMLTLGELLQIEGWTEELLYGPPRPAPASSEDGDEEAPRDFDELTPEEQLEHKRQAIEDQDLLSRDPNPIGIIRFITIYSDGKININTAPREVILALHKEITWEAVDQIITARDEARAEVAEADENGGVIPEEEPTIEEEGEEEDEASFRTTDLASYQAFVKRVNNGQAEEGEEAPAEIEGLNAEAFAEMKPWLKATSKIFMITSRATVGKITRSLQSLYRRTGSNAGANNQAPDTSEGTTVLPPNGGEDDGLPAKPEIKLKLLMRDWADE